MLAVAVAVAIAAALVPDAAQALQLAEGSDLGSVRSAPLKSSP